MEEPLAEYRKKRDAAKTPEPMGGRSSGTPIFVVQKHDASHLHYDLRLEINGVLASWAVPKGPSLNPKDKRLAVRTEDHPLDYAKFEGVIPEGYGAGTVMVWDTGNFECEDAEAGLRKGTLSFKLTGKKLKGEWSLFQMKDRLGKSREGSRASREIRGEKNWLLSKKQDEFASEKNILEEKPDSAISGKSLEQIKSP